MSSTKTDFSKGFAKTAGLPKWLHELPHQKASVPGHSRKGVQGLLKRRGVK
jgi:hypothetical protein